MQMTINYQRFYLPDGYRHITVYHTCLSNPGEHFLIPIIIHQIHRTQRN